MGSDATPTASNVSHVGRKRRPERQGMRRSMRRRAVPHVIDTEVLWNRTRLSRDKMFLIAHTSIGGSSQKWYVVQVDEEETDEAKARLTGEYLVCWWHLHHEDCLRRPVPRCRFLLDVREIRPDGSFGPGRAVKPAKARTTLAKRPNLGWYQLPILLVEERIVGPFKRQRRKSRSGYEANHTLEVVWQELWESAADRGIDVSKLDVVPRAVQSRAGHCTRWT